MNVNAVSIFPTKLSNAQKSDKWSESFRLCILEEDCDKLLDSSRLPAGVIIREWFFEGQSTAPATRRPASTSQATSFLPDVSAAPSANRQQTHAESLHVNDNYDNDNTMLVDNTGVGLSNPKSVNPAVDSHIDAGGALLSDHSDTDCEILKLCHGMC